MRARSIASEAARNLASGTARAAMLVLVDAAVVGALAYVDVRAGVEVLRDAADFRASGSAVQVLEVQQGVDGARCDALASVTGVVASGAIRQGDPLRALAMPSSPVTVWEATPGIVDLIADTGGRLARPSAEGGGLWISRDLAETLGVRPGGPVPTSTGTTTAAGLYTWPDDGRARTLGYAALAPVAPTGVFDQCWVQVWPTDVDTARILNLALDPTKADQATVGRLNTSLGADFDAPALLARRATVRAPLGAVVAGLLLGYVAIRLRRLELAAALHARVRKAHLAWQHLLEALAWATAGTAIAAAAVAYAASTDNPDPSTWAFVLGARTIVAGAAAVLVGTLLGVAATRERHLFRYFKDR